MIDIEQELANAKKRIAYLENVLQQKNVHLSQYWTRCNEFHRLTQYPQTKDDERAILLLNQLMPTEHRKFLKGYCKSLRNRYQYSEYKISFLKKELSKYQAQSWQNYLNWRKLQNKRKRSTELNVRYRQTVREIKAKLWDKNNVLPGADLAGDS